MRTTHRSTLAFTLLAPLLVMGACAPDDAGDDAADAAAADAIGQTDDAASDPQDAFWANLSELCGEAYAGEIVASEPAGTEGTDRLFRVAFDLTEPVEVPPGPWGS